MVRRSSWIALLVATLLFAMPESAFAQDCTYCDQDLEGKNPLKCANCIKLSTQVTKNNKRVWLIDFKQGTVGRVQIKDDTGDSEAFWYLPYTLTNKDSVPHEFFIDISATSDRGKHKFRYHDLWIPDVYTVIREHLSKQEDDQLLSQRDVSMPPPGKKNVLPKIDDRKTKRTAVIALPVIQPGETLSCVAILGPFHNELDKLVIAIRGLTNSSILTKHDYVAPKDDPHRRVINEAVLELHYSRPGDEFSHDTDALVFVKRKWTDVQRTINSDLKWRPSVLPGRR